MSLRRFHILRREVALVSRFEKNYPYIRIDAESHSDTVAGAKNFPDEFCIRGSLVPVRGDQVGGSVKSRLGVEIVQPVPDGVPVYPVADDVLGAQFPVRVGAAVCQTGIGACQERNLPEGSKNMMRLLPSWKLRFRESSITPPKNSRAVSCRSDISEKNSIWLLVLNIIFSHAPFL